MRSPKTLLASSRDGEAQSGPCSRIALRSMRATAIADLLAVIDTGPPSESKHSDRVVRTVHRLEDDR
jgi:hypothetical protein